MRTITSAFEPTERLRAHWKAILASFEAGIESPDATNELFWSAAVADGLLQDVSVKLLDITNDESSQALFPYFRTFAGYGPFRVGQLRSLNTVFGGRSALLVHRHDAAIIQELLEGLIQCENRWGVLVTRSIVGSASLQNLVDACARSALRIEEVGRNTAPYIELPHSWDEMSARLPRSLRWRIKKGEKELRNLGELEYREVRLPEAASRLLNDIYCVDERSWKGPAGVAIASSSSQRSFYETLVPAAASCGYLSGHVLALDKTPISYILGLTGDDGSFLALKSSFVESLAKLAPGHVLKRFAIEALIERGLKFFDFMGRCDEHKMRWTENTYETVTLAIYNRSWQGYIARLRRNLSRLKASDESHEKLPTRRQHLD